MNKKGQNYFEIIVIAVVVMGIGLGGYILFRNATRDTESQKAKIIYNYNIEPKGHLLGATFIKVYVTPDSEVKVNGNQVYPTVTK